MSVSIVSLGIILFYVCSDNMQHSIFIMVLRGYRHECWAWSPGFRSGFTSRIHLQAGRLSPKFQCCRLPKTERHDLGLSRLCEGSRIAGLTETQCLYLTINWQLSSEYYLQRALLPILLTIMIPELDRTHTTTDVRGQRSRQLGSWNNLLPHGRHPAVM